jgi:hypothetical protein
MGQVVLLAGEEITWNPKKKINNKFRHNLHAAAAAHVKCVCMYCMDALSNILRRFAKLFEYIFAY